LHAEFFLTANRLFVQRQTCHCCISSWYCCVSSRFLSKQDPNI